MEQSNPFIGCFFLLLVALETEAALVPCPRAFLDIGPFSCQCFSDRIRCDGTGDNRSQEMLRAHLIRSNLSIPLLELHLNVCHQLLSRFLDNVPLVGLTVTDSNISTVDEEAFEGLSLLEALGLSGNVLTSVPSAALGPLLHLERLDLSHNRIESIEEGAFETLTELRFLDLSGNKLTQISDEAFRGVVRLEQLDLTGCHLHQPPVIRLPNLGRLSLSRCRLNGELNSYFPDSLLHLDLSHNTITGINPYIFSHLHALQDLDFSWNLLFNLSSRTFDEMHALRSLDLSHNQLESLPPNGLGSFPALTLLRLDSNFLQEIHRDFVLEAPGIQEITLTDNNIRYVDVKALKRMKNLHTFLLNDNLLQCTCAILPMITWLIEARSQLTEESRESVICEEPLYLQGSPLTDLHDSELPCEGDDTPAPVDDYLDHMRRIDGLLREHRLEGGHLRLSWFINNPPLPYKCDSLFVWEQDDPMPDNFLQYEVECNSRRLSDPQFLSVAVDLSSIDLRPSTYHLCLVLFSRDHPLVLCSDTFHLDDAPLSPSPCPERVSIQQTGDETVTFSWRFETNSECRAEVTLWIQHELVFNTSGVCSAHTQRVGGLTSGRIYDACVSFGSSCGKTCTQLTLAGHRSIGALIGGLATGLSLLFIVGAFLFYLIKKRHKKYFELDSQGPRYKVLLEAQNSAVVKEQ